MNVPQNNPFHAIFRSVPDHYLLLTPDLTIVDATDTYLKMHMVKRDDIVGHNLFEIFPENPDKPNPEAIENYFASIQRVMQHKVSDSTAVVKYDIRHLDGQFEEHFWSLLITPIFNEHHEVQYILHRVEDVTEYVKLEKKGTDLETRAGVMQTEIYQRAQEIQEANKQLNASYEEAANKKKELEFLYDKLEKFDRVKTQFFANVSHELRTPLTLIMGPLEKLISNENLKPHEHELKTIERNAYALLKLVNDLLDVARLESGKMEMQYTSSDIARVVQQTTSLFETYAQQHEFNFQVKTPATLIADVDIDKLQRILMNLLSNAFKFTPANGTICCELNQEADHVTIRISDTGPGIPSHLYDAVFERFFQVDDYAMRQFGGFGLGLSIVKDFVELHHGTIAIEKELTGGTAFVIKLPLKAPADTIIREEIDETPILAHEMASQIIAELQTQDKSYTTERIITARIQPIILVVEDNVDMIEYIADMLSSSYQVIMAYNGQEGLDMASKILPDLVISDIMMPVMDGMQMVKELRELPELQDTPILILTARADKEMQNEMLKLGANDYITKPFSHTELKTRVDNVINLKRTKDELRERNMQLVHQEKIAALWNLTTGIAHEIKNPLNFVINCAELSLDNLNELVQIRLSNQELLERFNLLQTNLTVILRHGRRASEVIQKMTEHALAKAESRSPTNFNEFMNEAIAISEQRLHGEFPDCKVNLITFYDSTLPLIAIDTTAMLKVIYALLNNAFYSLWHKKLTIDETFIPTIEVQIKNLGRQCQLRIRDNGGGIPHHLKSRIFTPFFTTKATGEGVGLGLSLSYNTIVQEHNGMINFESVEGEGTEFIITLPI